MGDGRLSLRSLVILLGLLYLQTTWADMELNPDQDYRPYEVVGTSAGAGSNSENGNEGSNYQHVGILHSRRQRRSPHIGLYHGHSHQRPVYVQHYAHPNPHHHGGYGHGHHSGSNSHSQAHAVSANFAGPYGNTGFSGAAASSGGGSSSHLNSIGYGR